MKVGLGAGRGNTLLHFRGESKAAAISERFTATMARPGRSHTIYAEALLARANAYIDVSCADSPYNCLHRVENRTADPTPVS